MTLKQKIFLPLTLVVLLVVSGCDSSSEVSTVRSLPGASVQVEPLVPSEVPFEVEVAGTLQAVEQALISARVSGQVVAVPVRAGSVVKKGDLLVKISAAEISAQVLRVEAQLSQARRNLARETKLQKANASTREAVKSLKEMVQIAEAAYREAKAMLDYTVVRAPFSGVVTQKMVEVGDLAAPGGPLLKLENGAALEVVVAIPEALVSTLTLGAKLLVNIPAANLQLMTAISEIAPTVDPQSRTTRIKLKLPENVALRSGQFARVSLADKGTATLLIAKTALQQQGQLEQVFVAEQGVARLRLVRSGASYGDRVEILSGLRAGDQVIVAANTRLHDGQPLKDIKTGLSQ